ncbi:MAG: hypothetical protein NVSMB24_39520 [Mucilaginibacter sp.]
MIRNERERVAQVNRFLKMESSKDQELQHIVILAAQICKARSASITLIDKDKQYIKYNFGSDLGTTSREDSFCTYTIQQHEVLVVPNALKDHRFVNNPFVKGDPHIRFYAGAPLTCLKGYNIGSLCVTDSVTRNLSDHQQQTLQILAKQVIHLLEFDLAISLLKEQFKETQNSETKLRAFFESSMSCHLLIGENKEILDFNKSVAKVVKSLYNVTLIIGMQVTEIIEKSFKKEFIKHYQSALRGIHVTLERHLTNKDKETWWSANFDPAFDKKGKVIGVCYNAVDITEKVQKEKKVRAQNEQLKKIAFIQSHELRRPVASILGLMNIIKGNNYIAEREEIDMLAKAVNDLDVEIRRIVECTESANL